MVNVKDQLEAIRAKNSGLLTEEAILKAAKAKNHPLHDRFTWNDSEAAKLWRLEQARDLIRSVYVTIEQPNHQPISVRAYASLPTDRISGAGYRSIQDVMSDERLRSELLATALTELEAFRIRYNSFKELAPVFAAIETVQQEPEASVKTKSKMLPRRKPHGTAATA